MDSFVEDVDSESFDEVGGVWKDIDLSLVIQRMREVVG